MRMLRRVLPFMLATTVLGSAIVQSQAQSFTLNINAVQDVVKVGSKVRVKIELKNTSQGNIALTGIPWEDKRDHPEIEGIFRIVTDRRGNEPPLTRWGGQVFGRPLPGDNSVLVLNSVIDYPLEPGKVHTTEVVVSDLYDLSIPGAYTIHIPYEASWSANGLPLVCCGRFLHEPKKDESKKHSNVITVTIEP